MSPQLSTQDRLATFPLCKTADPADFARLPVEVDVVEHYGGNDLAAQDPMRRWEYAMALRAWAVWLAREDSRRTPDERPYRLLDVGGAGSPLTTIFNRMSPPRFLEAQVCDPKLNHAVEHFAKGVAAGCFDAVFSISTIEHVKAPVPFIKALAHLTAPGGLCFLTSDYWNCTGPDQAHFHWMRERIYNRESWVELYKACHQAGFQRLTQADWTYHGDQLYGSYTMISMALVKEAPCHL